MTEFPAPPPDEPVDDSVRARIREQILAGFEDTPTRARGRWAVPLAAAAAVALVAAMTGYVVGRGGGDSVSTVSPAGQGPAPATTSTTADDPTPDQPETSEAASPPTMPPSSSASPTPDPCDDEVTQFLKGAESAVTFGEGNVQGTFYVKGDTWTACETTTETLTIQGDGKLDAPYVQNDPEPFQVSTNVVGFTPKHMTQIFVAGGPMPEGVAAISYAFPDGSIQVAETKTDDEGRTWWRMEYAAQEGVLSDPKQNQLDLDPIEVTVSLSGVQDTTELAWGEDTCAQLNHGC